MDKRAILAILIVALVFAVILVYEWSGSLRKYKMTLDKAEVLTKKTLEEARVPLWLLPLVTLVDYVKHSWFCLLIAFIAAGAIQEFVPRQKIVALLGARRGFLAYAVGAGGGPMLSMCSCSVIPLFGGIYKRGAGLGPALAFLLAAPALNPAAVLLTVGLLSWKFAVARIIVGIGSGMLVGFLTFKIMRNRVPAEESLKMAQAISAQAAPLGTRIKNMFLYSWEFVKLVLPLILLGVLLAGAVKAFLPGRVIVKYLGAGFFPIAIASGMGVVLYTPTLVEIPFVKGMIELGMGTGPAMAFLLTGPALSLPSILGVTRIVSGKVPLVYAVLMWVCGIFAGLSFWLLAPVL
jgi:hypothetical protein